MTTPAASAPNVSQVQEPPFAPALVEDMLRQFAKAVRTHQLYLPNNSIYQRAIDTLRATFLPLWAQTDQLVLSVGESEFRWEAVAVGHEPSRGDSVAWIFYKDGIRELTFEPGVEKGELVTLLDILHRVRKASPEEDDLLTLLWEHEFVHIKYRYVDLAADSAPPIPGADVSSQPTSVTPPEQMETLEERPGIVRLDELDSALYFLEETEIEYLRSEVHAEYRSDLRCNVLSILFDVFEVQTAASVREEVLSVVEGYLPHLLAAGAFSAVAFVLREALVAAERAPSLDPGHRKRLRALPDRLSEAAALSELLQALDEATEVPPQEDLDALFAELRPQCLSIVFTWLGKLQNARLRPALEAAAARIASANTSELVRLILSSDPVVAIEAIRRAGELKTAAAVAPLNKVITAQAANLRQVAAHALSEIGSAGAMRALEQAIEDADRDVRVTVMRALGTRGHRAALPKVEALIRNRDARSVDLTEKMALFETFGALAGEDGIQLLNDLLNGRSLFGRREDPETRACAAMALGRIGSGTALESLRKASSEKEVLVRNAINRAMRGGTS